MQDLVKTQQIKMNEVIGCRDDIMTYLLTKNVPKFDAFQIMEQVRKGKQINGMQIKLLHDHNVPN